MEREGSGYDRMYEVLLAVGKPIPVLSEGDDRVTVKVEKRIVNKDVIQFMEKVNNAYQLRSKEMISLGLIAQHKSLTAIEFSNILGLDQKDAIRNWLGRLPEFGLIESSGRTKGTSYFVMANVLRRHKFKGKTTLRNIESHRLKELIIEDLRIHGNSSISEINHRIGTEIQVRRIRYLLNKMIETEEIIYDGDRKWRRYFINK